VLGDVPEYFSTAVKEATKPGLISDPVGLEAQEFVSTTVGGTSARHIRPPQFARVMRRLRRLHCPKRAVSSGYRASPRLRLVEL